MKKIINTLNSIPKDKWQHFCMGFVIAPWPFLSVGFVAGVWAGLAASIVAVMFAAKTKEMYDRRNGGAFGWLDFFDTIAGGAAAWLIIMASHWLL